jgi:hydrogenase maturation factor
MCLAIPSRIVKIDNEMATIDVDGVQRQASCFYWKNRV